MTTASYRVAHRDKTKYDWTNWALVECGGYAEDDELSSEPVKWQPLPNPPKELL